MKKGKVLLSLVVGIIAMFVMSISSKALTIDTTETPTTVYSGEKFNIVLKFDKELFTTTGYLAVDNNLVSIKESGDEVAISQYSKEQGLYTWVYAPYSGEKTINSITMEATAANVTKETVAEFKLTEVAGNEKNSSEEKVEDTTFKVTIKPVKDLTIGKSEVNLKVGDTEKITADGNGTLKWESSNENVAKVDSNGNITAIAEGNATITITDEKENKKNITVIVTGTTATEPVKDNTTAKGNLVQTGESKILLSIVCALIIISIALRLKSKKFNKLFVILPLALTISIFGGQSNAATVDTKDVQTEKIDAGIFDNLVELEGTNVLAISPRSGFYKDINDDTKNKLYLSDLDAFFTTNSISISSINNDNVTSKSIQLKTGDVLKDSNNKEYTLVLFGDIDKNGTICQAGDFSTIRETLLTLAANKELNKIQRLAANVRYEKDENGKALINKDGLTVLNAFDLSRLRYKALSYDGHAEKEDKLSGTLVYESIYSYDETSKDNFELSQNSAKIANYATLGEAVEAAGTNSSIIKVLKDVTVSDENIEVKNNQDITLDLNGKQVQVQSGGSRIITVSGKLQINDTASNGSIKRNSLKMFKLNNDNAKIIINSGEIYSIGQTIDGGIGEVIVNNGSISGIVTTVISADKITVNNGNISGSIQGNDINIKGGQLAASRNTIKNLGSKNTTVVIDGGNIQSDSEATVIDIENFEGFSNNITINGGTITKVGTSPATAVSVYGTLKMTGGSITGNNVVISNAVAINGDFTMTGGTITGGSGSKGAIYQSSGNTVITGGSVNSGISSIYAIMQENEGNVTISNASIIGYKYAIYQEKAGDVNIYYDESNSKNTEIIQSSSVDSLQEDSAAIYKKSSGNIQIGKSEDTKVYKTELKVSYKNYGIIAENATVKFLNGWIEKSTYSLGSTIKSAKEIVQSSKFTPSGYKIFGDTTKSVEESMYYNNN